MALSGEIQEPPALKFRADSLHSGSISFGRFEAESLSWERRSSFSHNRHLEELERYSKPGSVTEKAAYFEAHFRRKALLSQSSSECQNGTDYQTSENDESENMVFRDELEHSDEGNHLIQFDKSSVGSDNCVESEVMQYGREALEIPHVEPVVPSSVSDGGGSMQGGCEHVNPEEVHQNETDRFHVIDAELGREVREESHDEVVNVDLSLSSKATNLTTDNHTATMHDSAHLEHYRESSLEAGSQLGSKTVKAKSKSLSNITRVQRNVSSDLRKVDTKKPTRIERESSWTTKSEKQSPQVATPIICSVHRTSKPEVPESSKLKLVHANKRQYWGLGCREGFVEERQKQHKTKAQISEKELNSKKIVEPKPSVSDKVVPKARQTTNRPKLTENSAKPGMKLTSAVNNLTRDQLAERRKEYLQEKEAEIKELRKSLNFRARPMPSFYHAAVQRDSRKQEAVSSNTKSNRLNIKSAQVCQAAGKSPPFGKAGNPQSHSNSGNANTSDTPQESAATNYSLAAVSSETSATSRTHKRGNI